MIKGYLALIGGGEDSSLIFNRIFEIAGGKANTKLAIIPSASSHASTTLQSYLSYFSEELQIPKENIWLVPLAAVDDKNTADIDESLWKNNAYSAEIAEKITQYDVIFFVGGDQRKYIDTLRRENIESPLLNAIEKVYKNGGTIAATSAGTNILGETSIAGGRSEEALTNRIAYNITEDDGTQLLLLKGFGFIKNVIFDTHFDTRGRLGRIIEGCVLTNKRFGIGISEKTAAIYHPDSILEIVGNGDVLMVDIKESKILNKPDEPLHIFNVKSHLFMHGDRFNMFTYQLMPASDKECIINTPYFDVKDYHISLNVFKEYETSNIVINYMLDNEAKEAVAIMDYNKKYTAGDNSSFLRFTQKEETNAYFTKCAIDNPDELVNCYTGLNIMIDVIPLYYSTNNSNNPSTINCLIFGIDNDFHLVVFDNVATNPICDAKIEIFNNEEKLIYKSGTSKFGKAIIQNILSAGQEYQLRISYDVLSVSKKFTFSKNMKGVLI